MASISSAFAQEVLHHPKLQHAAVRVGLWLAAVAEQKGGFPLTLNYMHFIEGIPGETDLYPGVQFRMETVVKSLKSLEDEGLLKVETINERNKRHPKKYTLVSH